MIFANPWFIVLLIIICIVRDYLIKKRLIGILMALHEKGSGTKYPDSPSLKRLANRLPPELILNKIEHHLDKLK